MVQGVCPGRSERFFRDKQSRRVGGNGEVGKKRGMEKSERNAEEEVGEKRGRRRRRETRGGEKERKHSEKEIRSRSHDRLRTNYNPIINN